MHEHVNYIFSIYPLGTLNAELFSVALEVSDWMCPYALREEHFVLLCLLSLFLHCLPKYVLLATWGVKYKVK